jgi:hypothetical protein
MRTSTRNDITDLEQQRCPTDTSYMPAIHNVAVDTHTERGLVTDNNDTGRAQVGAGHGHSGDRDLTLSRRVEVGYVEVANHLRDDIRAGVYAPSTRLPSERRLAAHYRVSRDLVRDALRVVAGEGLLIRKGVGSSAIVAPEPSRTPILLPANAEVTARMPSPEERRIHGIDSGTTVPLLVVRHPGRQTNTYAAHSFVLHTNTET